MIHIRYDNIWCLLSDIIIDANITNRVFKTIMLFYLTDMSDYRPDSLD